MENENKVDYKIVAMAVILKYIGYAPEYLDCVQKRLTGFVEFLCLDYVNKRQESKKNSYVFDEEKVREMLESEEDKKLFDEYGADYFYFALKHTMNLEKRVNKDETEKEKIIKDYKNFKIKRIAKIWQREVKFEFGETGTEEIAAYEENGKYYLRIITCFCHVHMIHKRCSRKPHYEVWHNDAYTKEFDSRECANKYFQKCTENGDWKRVQ